jgi:RNA polymerase sigma-70 factor, ECF subfamily
MPSLLVMLDEITLTALAARDGDERAAASFVRSTQVDVWRMCVHLGDRAHAEDLAQETYLRAFRALPSFQARSSARTWLLSIARRVCADAVRDIQRRPRTNPMDDLLIEPSQHGDVAEGVALRHALTGLQRDRYEAFVLTQMVGLSYPEAAEACDCPVGTIRSRVARARADLLDVIEGQRRLA